eukprot:TRINITY_DN8651_c0_g1_i1.p1 TRINITY_DN8651_c0_g1~~TRINITY_DN8651_c0_g1_i1.p1  ORF type:complete len:338 (-),score=119.48 TRINITY_DN8651_c0_g1_i1:88-1101(-)
MFSRVLPLARASVPSRAFSASSASQASLVLAEVQAGKLNAATLHTVTAAAQIDSEVDIVVAAEGAEALAAEAATIAGVRKVLAVDTGANPTGERLTEVLRAVQKEGSYTAILAAASASGKNVIPRLAAYLDVQPISEIQAVKSADTFVHPIYAGNALETVQTSDSVKLVTVRTTSFEKAAATGGSAEIAAVAAPEAVATTSFKSADLAKSDRPELGSADIVISGGRALKSGDNFKILYDLADEVGAAVGASRAAVDAGYVPNDLQVGQTGKIVAPTLYFAVGISGAIQHLAGMSSSKTIVAINTDPDAPIFQVADYGLHQDLFTAVPELQAAIAAAK